MTRARQRDSFPAQGPQIQVEAQRGTRGFAVALFCLGRAPAAAAELKVDLNKSGRPEAEVNQAGFVAWPVADGRQKSVTSMETVSSIRHITHAPVQDRVRGYQYCFVLLFIRCRIALIASSDARALDRMEV